MAKWLELYVLPIIRVQRCWIRNPLVKTHGALNVILEALMLVVIQTGNLALTHLSNEIAGSLLMNAGLLQLPIWLAGLLIIFILLATLERSGTR